VILTFQNKTKHLQALSNRFYWNVSTVNSTKGKYFQYFLFEWQNTNQEFRSDLQLTVTLLKEIEKLRYYDNIREDNFLTPHNINREFFKTKFLKR